MNGLPMSFAAALSVAPLCFIVVSTSAAAEPAYLDDRSSAARLVHSLYNAINRHEMGRAWSYFGETKPAKDFDTFSKGYDDTQRVDIETGAVSEEGAAGSIYYQVPTAIRAVDNVGKEMIFAGCYTARLANPQVQGEDFRPMHIEKGVLKPADGDLAAAVPASCGDEPPPDKADIAFQQARDLFAASYRSMCQTLPPDAERGATEEESFEISFKYSYETDADSPRTAHLFKFHCGSGAYNTMEVYYLANDVDEVRQLQFAEPDLDIRYESEDSDEKVESINIIGYRAQDQLVNSSYDPATRTLTSFSKWRGVADASSSGTYIFRDGVFSLVKYDVDASYDGESNPETILDYYTAP